MNKFPLSIKIIFLMALGFLSSCSNEDRESPGNPTDDEFKFDISILTRDGTEENIDNDKYGYFTTDVSCVYISQRASSLNIDFTAGSSNCYKYVYKENPAANWGQGFNFTPVSEALHWGKILENGQFGQVFAFAILFFPEGDNEDYPYKVGAQQDQADSFKEWDILGGYHRTGKVRDRLQFKLKHMLCRMKINLYIPVVDEKLASGYNVSDVSAQALSFRTDYTVGFGDMDSEGIPLAQPSYEVGVEGSVEDIQMKKTYQTPGECEDEPLTGLENFMIQDSDLKEDIVKKFTFEMIFPSQTITGNLFRFTLNLNGVPTNFMFNTSNLTHNDGNFKFEGGSVTNLDLYLPRSDNKILLIKADILDWKEGSIDFVVTPDADRQK